MGAIFEELIRRFSEQSTETAGEHFTPREVVRLMVNLLLAGDEEALRDEGAIRHVFDCACGTGGMLSEAEEQIRRSNVNATVRLFGQELNPEAYAICLADMLVKGQDASRTAFGNSLSADGHAGPLGRTRGRESRATSRWASSIRWVARRSPRRCMPSCRSVGDGTGVRGRAERRAQGRDCSDRLGP